MLQTKSNYFNKVGLVLVKARRRDVYPACDVQFNKKILSFNYTKYLL